MRPPSRLVIVRRDHPGVFAALLQGAGRWPAGTAVMWDRREQERRVANQPVATERRVGECRAEADSMWHTHGFIVLEISKLPSEAILLQPLRRHPAPARRPDTIRTGGAPWRGSSQASFSGSTGTTARW